MAPAEKPAKTRWPLTVMLRHANHVAALLAPACARLEIAGSIRRGRADVGDVELVAIPHHEPAQRDLFGAVTATRDVLDACCAELLAEGVLRKRLGADGHPAWGPKYKRMLWRASDDTLVPVDLFCATPDTWGLIQLLRTGPGVFNVRLVTVRTTRLADGTTGWLPTHLSVHDGALWHAPSGARIPTPDEATVFQKLGLPFLEPVRRTDTVRPLGWTRAGASGWTDPAAQRGWR